MSTLNYYAVRLSQDSATFFFFWAPLFSPSSPSQVAEFPDSRLYQIRPTWGVSAKITEIHTGARLPKLQKYDNSILILPSFRLSPKYPSQVLNSSHNCRVGHVWCVSPKVIKFHIGARLPKLQNYTIYILLMNSFRLSPKSPSQVQNSSQNVEVCFKSVFDQWFLRCLWGKMMYSI
jgi:hypothetical protein